jgi:iron-sulfur cluster assembly protein
MSRGFGEINAFWSEPSPLDLCLARDYLRCSLLSGARFPARRKIMAVARRKLKVMSLTDAAAARVREILANSDKPLAGLRVGVKNGGCAGMSYTMEMAEAAHATDEIVEDKGVTVLIDPKAILFLLGTEMDYQTTKLSSGFVFNNPNQTSACGCGESVAITPASPELAASELAGSEFVSHPA